LCRGCQQGFTQAGNRAKHEKSKHGLEPENDPEKSD